MNTSPRRSIHRRPAAAVWAVALLALALAAPTVAARNPPRAGAAAQLAAIESCVDREAIRFGRSELRAVLDAADAAGVSAALLRRYPVIDRDGLAIQKIMLWRKERAGWLYVALLENPEKPGDLCFTASFVAAGIDATKGLVVKYFGAAAEGH